MGIGLALNPIKFNDFFDSYKRIRLNKILVSSRCEITRHALEHANIHEVWGHTIDTLCYQLDTYLWGKLMPKTIEYPSNWWEALKAEYAPKWFLSRWPVENKVIHYSEMKIVLLEDLVPDDKMEVEVVAKKQWRMQ